MKTIKLFAPILFGAIAALIAGFAFDAKATSENTHWVELSIRYFFWLGGMACSGAAVVVFIVVGVSNFLDSNQ